ncbi:MAG: hypothetical protein AB7E85_03830, partial [Pseudobdellovibrionaceae bacterium]
PLQPDQIAYYRSVLDQLFFLIMYVIIDYLLSSVCFKMTDEVPNNITRWMSAGIKSFGDMAKDPAEQLTTYASMAGYRFAPKISDMVMDTSRMAGNLAGRATNRPDGGSAIKDMVDGALGIRQPSEPTPPPPQVTPDAAAPGAGAAGAAGATGATSPEAPPRGPAAGPEGARTPPAPEGTPPPAGEGGNTTPQGGETPPEGGETPPRGDRNN